ncbi:MAG: hypothetical protein IKX20_06645 [Paludibacteraceae bacterium]|nr:hypothetical protein [Paludibacteraceae bacterium]
MNSIIKRLTTFAVCLILATPLFADGLHYFNHCKSLYSNGRYEEAKQGFTLCKVYDDVNSADMDAWIAKCDQAIEAKKNKAFAVAKKLAAERQAAYEERQREREERNLVFISTNARTLSANYSSMQSAIKGNLQQYHFAKSEEDAKWGVYVTANAREYSTPDTNPAGVFIVYVDAVCQIIDLLTGEIVFEQEYFQKRGFANLAMAVELAYKDLVKAVSNDINDHLS